MPNPNAFYPRKEDIPFELLSEEELKELCEEIETQWEYHVMTRAVFPSTFHLESGSLRSPAFYLKLGMNFQISMPVEKSTAFKRAQAGVAYWHNQNYVIRLFGILDSYRIIGKGIKDQVRVIKLLKILRNNVGAHSTGRRPSDTSTLRRATRIINKLYDKGVNVQQVSEYALAIDKVLEPMKIQIIEYVKTLTRQYPLLDSSR